MNHPARAKVVGRARAGYDESFIHIVQGEYHVTDDPNLVLTTILGSCVAACIRDPQAGVGGMNHFLLPAGSARDGGGSLRFGVHAMELLINDILRLGGRRDRLEAKLFGGGRMMQGLRDIGGQNAAFAQDFLRREGIAFAGGSLGGEGARRVEFWPVSGRARQALLGTEAREIFVEERKAKRAAPPEAGEVDLF